MYPEIYSAVYDFGICPKNIVRCKYFYILHNLFFLNLLITIVLRIIFGSCQIAFRLGNRIVH